MRPNMLIAENTDGTPEYIVNLKTAIVTTLSRGKVEQLQKMNPDLLSNYRFISYNDVDFSWWDRASRYLTSKKLYTGCIFSADYCGNVERIY